MTADDGGGAGKSSQGKKTKGDGAGEGHGGGKGLDESEGGDYGEEEAAAEDGEDEGAWNSKPTKMIWIQKDDRPKGAGPGGVVWDDPAGDLAAVADTDYRSHVASRFGTVLGPEHLVLKPADLAVSRGGSGEERRRGRYSTFVVPVSIGDSRSIDELATDTLRPRAGEVQFAAKFIEVKARGVGAFLSSSCLPRRL